MVAMQMDNSLKLINDKTLILIDNDGNILLRHKPIWTKFVEFKKVRDNCIVVREDCYNFPKENKDKANIYCLDNNFKLRWTIDSPFQNDTFPNAIVWNKQTVERRKENGYLTLDLIDNSNTFVCSSWNGFTVTIEYETGRTISKEFTK